MSTLLRALCTMDMLPSKLAAFAKQADKLLLVPLIAQPTYDKAAGYATGSSEGWEGVENYFKRLTGGLSHTKRDWEGGGTSSDHALSYVAHSTLSITSRF